MGGAQAIAALALGTATIRPVLKVFGPGNAYVTAAKKLLFGQVAVDLLAGPSELLVLADATADPRWVAADMLAQAEHGSGEERVWLVTTSRRVLAGVPAEIKRQQATLPRSALTERAVAHGAVCESVCARTSGSFHEASGKSGAAVDDRGRNFSGAVVADGSRRLHRRTESHLADRWSRGSGRGVDGRPIYAADQPH